MKVWTTEQLVCAAYGGKTEMDLKRFAEELGICPLDLFRQAYSTWFQDGPNDELVGHYFENYVGEGVMPHWVRLYIEALSEKGGRFVPAPMQAVA